MFTLFCFAFMASLGVAGVALEPTPALAIAILFVGLVFLPLVAWTLRRMASGRWSYDIQRYTAQVGDRSVELVFDEKLMVYNRLTLLIDGRVVNRGTIFYGTKTLEGTGEGADSAVSVEVGSGWVGTCTGVVARADGREFPMSRASSTASAAATPRAPQTPA